MKKLNKKEIKTITQKLKPFWKDYEKIYSRYLKQVYSLEKQMNIKLKPKVKLGFFYVEGECVGVGAEDYSDRKYFPLIHDGDLS